jgi:hypothetical protein
MYPVLLQWSVFKEFVEVSFSLIEAVLDQLGWKLEFPNNFSAKVTAFCDVALCSLIEIDQYPWAITLVMEAVHTSEMFYQFLHDHVALYPRRLSSSCFPPWEPEIQLYCRLTLQTFVQICWLYPEMNKWKEKVDVCGDVTTPLCYICFKEHVIINSLNWSYVKLSTCSVCLYIFQVPMFLCKEVNWVEFTVLWFVVRHAAL